MPRFISILLLTAIVDFSHAAEPFEGFAETRIACHGPKKTKGDLRLDQLSRDFKSGVDGQVWAEVVEKINAGEMPPEDEAQPTADEIGKVIAQLDVRIREGRAARMAARPAVAHYRLSRQEYQNTVYDLLGVRYDPAKPGELNEDTLWHGYERIGSQLSFRPRTWTATTARQKLCWTAPFPPPWPKPVRFARQPRSYAMAAEKNNRRLSTG